MSSSGIKSYGVCVFCGRAEDDDDQTFGAFLKKEGISVHYFCMLFSSALIQRGKTSRQGISGFLIRDIKKEVARGNRLRCVFCKNTGATIGCAIPKCVKKFHMPCGLEKHTLHQYFGNYLSFCAEHRPQQEVLPSNGCQTRHAKTSICPICLDSVESCASNDTLQATCCMSTWMHRACLQAQARNAGYFFKCPLCNNKKKFQIQMLTFGIYVPEQDASWEQDSDAYGDLLFRHNQCDHSACQCPNGVNHNIEGSRWQIVLCAICGSQGCHIACGKLKFSKPHFECDQCKSILKSLHEKSQPPTKILRGRQSHVHAEASPNRRENRRTAAYQAQAQRKMSINRIRRCLTKQIADQSTSKPAEERGSPSSETSECELPRHEALDDDVDVDVEVLEVASIHSGTADEIEVCDDDDKSVEYNRWRLSPTDFPSPKAASTNSFSGSDDGLDIASPPIQLVDHDDAGTLERSFIDVEDNSVESKYGSYTPPLPGPDAKSSLV